MKEQIRRQIIALGADLCGFASIDRFHNAPEGFHPTDIFKDCKSVISIALALPRGLAKVNPRLIYGHYNGLTCPQIDRISFQASKWIEQSFRCFVVPIPCDSPYEYWDSEHLEGRGLLSMKHVAVQAGLGALGKNTLFMCKQYGNMVTLGCLLTDLEIDSDPLTSSACISGCHICIDACPVNAIGEDGVNQKLCRCNTYGKTERGFDTVDCNLCRIVCPVNAQ